jgi:hypothetical protein
MLTCKELKILYEEKKIIIGKEVVLSFYNKYFRQFELEFVYGNFDAGYSEVTAWFLLDLYFKNILVTFSFEYSYWDNELKLKNCSKFSISYKFDILLNYVHQNLQKCEHTNTPQIEHCIEHYKIDTTSKFEAMGEYVKNYYKKLHDTNHYTNLKATLTFLLIIKNYEIGLHKDIAIIIAKKILFFKKQKKYIFL